MKEDNKTNLLVSNGQEIQPVDRFWQLGIPTARDITDPSYLKALLVEKFNREFGFSWMPLSTVFVHNYVVGVLRDGGEDIGKVHEILAEDTDRSIPAVNDRVAGTLNPQYVLDVYRGSINEFRKRIASFLPLLTHLAESMTVSGEFPLDTIPPEITLCRKYYGEPMYTFVPYKLLSGQLARIEEQLIASLADAHPLSQIRRLWHVAKIQEEDPVNELITSSLHITDTPTRSTLENMVGTEAYELKRYHESVAKKSQMYDAFSGRQIDTSFPTKYGAVRQSVAIDLLVDGVHALHQNALFFRVLLRDRTLRHLDANRTIVVNGILVTKDQSGKLTAREEVPSWFVNLLGQPVYVDERVVEPDGWAREEKYLLDGYRNLTEEEARVIPPGEIVSELLQRYAGFDGNAGTGDIKYKVDLVRYTLRYVDDEL